MGQQQIDTFQDILDALDANPELQSALFRHLAKVVQTDDELRQEIRKEILTEELLQIPVRFLRLEQAVENLLNDTALIRDDVTVLKEDMALVKGDVSGPKEDMAQVKDDVAGLKGDVAELKQGVQRLEERQTTMSGQIANLAGSDYESKAIQPSKRLIRNRLAMVTATVVHAGQWNSESLEENMLLPAVADGRINSQQSYQLEDAGCIIRCQDQDGNIIHAVAEISITVQDTDRLRAAQRAEILATIAGTPAVPFVVGQEEEPPSTGVPNVSFLAYTG